MIFLDAVLWSWMADLVTFLDAVLWSCMAGLVTFLMMFFACMYMGDLVTCSDELWLCMDDLVTLIMFCGVYE